MKVQRREEKIEIKKVKLEQKEQRKEEKMAAKRLLKAQAREAARMENEKQKEEFYNIYQPKRNSTLRHVMKLKTLRKPVAMIKDLTMIEEDKLETLEEINPPQNFVR